MELPCHPLRLCHLGVLGDLTGPSHLTIAVSSLKTQKTLMTPRDEVPVGGVRTGDLSKQGAVSKFAETAPKFFSAIFPPSQSP